MKKKMLIMFSILSIILIFLFLIYWIYNKLPFQNWREYKSLVTIWPRIQCEKVESISFCSAPNEEMFKLENDSFFQEIFGPFYYKTRKDNEVKSWKVSCSIPPENLSECVKLIDTAIKNAKRWQIMPMIWLEKMMIVTNKGKYIVAHVSVQISPVDSPRVFGDEWKSYELGKFIAKHCFSNIEYKYSFPSKEEVVAILVYPLKFSPPLAIFGDLKKAKELLFEKDFPEPNGIHGIAGLYKFTRLRTFGIEAKEENGKFVTINELKPKKIFEGREWLDKIIDSYEIALKEASEKEKYYPGGPEPSNARIVFMTKDKDYWKEIAISENEIYDDYIKSKQLKKYFDDIGLTKEILAGEPIKIQKLN